MRKITPGWYATLSIVTSWSLMAFVAFRVFGVPFWVEGFVADIPFLGSLRMPFNTNALLWVLLPGFPAFPWGMGLCEEFSSQSPREHPVRDKVIFTIAGLLLGGVWGAIVVYGMGIDSSMGSLIVGTRDQFCVLIALPAIVAALLAVFA